MNTTSMRLEGASSQFDWNIDDVVERLRVLRNRSLIARNRMERPPVLPSRSVLAKTIEGFSAALFPNRLSSRQLAIESVDYFVGQILDSSCRDLVDQAYIELEFFSDHPGSKNDSKDKAIAIVREFASSLPKVRQQIDTDIQAVFDGDPAATSTDEILVCYPGVFAMLHHRLSHELYNRGLSLIARMISELAHSKTGIDIHPGASIGDSLLIDHGTGIVIGETTIIGNRVRLYHGVTLGAKSPSPTSTNREPRSPGSHPRHPIVEDDVVIYAGATLLGRIRVGRGAVIGGNVWVVDDVPQGATITQAQTRMITFSDGLGI